MFNENENYDDNENLFFEQSIGAPINDLYSQQDNSNDYSIDKSHIINSIFIVNHQSSINDVLNPKSNDNVYSSNSQAENSISLDTISRPSETKISSSSHDVFSVSKDMSVRKKMNQKMKKKAERIKLILKEKQQKEEEASSSNKARTFAEKQEKKILRNRMSAQKSRDKQKSKMENLELINNNLLEENEKLKQQINNNESVISYLSDNIKRCGNCCSLLNTITHQSIYFIPDNDNDSITSSGFRNWIKGFSVVGILCLVGIFMLMGAPGNVIQNKRAMRQLEQASIAYLDYEPKNASYFPIIKYTKDFNTNNNNNNEEAIYNQDEDKETIDKYALKKHLMEIINKNYLIEEKNLNEKEIIK